MGAACLAGCSMTGVDYVLRLSNSGTFSSFDFHIGDYAPLMGNTAGRCSGDVTLALLCPHGGHNRGCCGMSGCRADYGGGGDIVTQENT